MNAPPTNHVELFRYLRSVVDTTEQSRDPYPKFVLVEAYWHLGRIIVETEQAGTERADYGIHLIELLSQRLTESFGKGYSLPNMWRFKQFYLAYPILSNKGRELPDLRQHLRTELVWSHYRLLMQIKNLQERAFYMQQAADERWTVKLLQKLVRSRYYYQAALGQDQLLATTKKVVTATNPSHRLTSAQPQSLRTQVANLKKTLLERYVGYAFVAQRQFISSDGQDKWIDLVFFHLLLQRFVLVQFAEHNPANSASFAQLVDAYFSKQPPTISKPPVGLLVNNEGTVRLTTVSFESGLPADESALLPLTAAP
ncbi:PDDEXK nuclease domain-containing protein [Spirosoma oryzicola]|uniref:PDDEXK nuclease domain-containing protein n=1 Tax=Spirosoma oryzicola TaxID=2898794 RepID=UPI001E5A75A3|nr:PDDEXK nuclease domain-containing protein [Spirosoma oryzicola]UHG94854.1 PDDEXK nuclease domain-containing protein [Spirosoma oryzicola]